MEKAENNMDSKNSHSLIVVLREHKIFYFFMKHVIPGLLQLKKLYIGRENIFFTLLFNQMTMSPIEYDQMINKYLEEKKLTFAKYLGLFKEYNYILMSKDVDLLEKKSKLWNIIVKIAKPKGKEDSIELITKIQEISRPHYLTLIKQMDKGERYYDFLKENQKIKDCSEIEKMVEEINRTVKVPLFRI